MSKLLAVAARELRERWLLFPASLTLGFNPLVLPAFGVDKQAMPFLGLMTAFLLGAAAAVLIGSTMLARDAASGRLGFLFSRPLSWPTIWGGKWLAALVLVVSSGVLAAIPFMAVYPPRSHGGSWLRTLVDGPGWAMFLILLALGVGLANFGATAYRSRSPWLALDLALLAGGFWLTRQYVAPLWRYGILGKGEWIVAAGLLPLSLGLIVGSAVQVAVGRTDVRRAHRALSLAFWAVVASTLAAAGGYWQWVRSAAPADVTVHALTRDPAGRWIYVEGWRSRSGWYPHGLLIDTSSGRYARRPDADEEPSRWGRGLLFSADGRFASRPHLDRDGRGTALTLFDLTGETPRPTDVTLESSPPPTWRTSFVLSPSAASVFVVHESGASLFALPSGRRVASMTIGPGWQPAALRFPGEDMGRAWLVPAAEGPRRARAEMSVVELARDGRTRAASFAIAAPPDPPWSREALVPDSEGGRILTVDAGVHLRDGATGELLATLAEGGGRFSVLLLADGRIVVGDGNGAEPGPSRALLRVFDRVGRPLGQMRLDLSSGSLRIGPEVAPGRVAVSSVRAWFLPEDTLLVDIAEGRVVERISGLRPAMGFWGWGASTGSSAEGGPGSVHFFRDIEDRVLRIDFATGERKVVAGPGALPGERLRLR